MEHKAWILPILMKLIAVIVISLLTFGTIIYFYDSLGNAYQLIKIGRFTINKVIAHDLALLTAVVIGFGVLIESAPPIWHTLAHWGTVIHHRLQLIIYRKPQIVPITNTKIIATEQLLSDTNIALQSLIIPTDEAKLDQQLLQQLWSNTKKIKDSCDDINCSLQSYQTFDVISKRKQNLAKKHLGTLVSANLELCTRRDLI